jgi:anthranilate phosphoribosyltransferase
VATYAARLGVEALSGAIGPFRDSLVFGASICLTHLKRCDSLSDAAARVREVLDNGSARARFEAALRR